MAPGQRYFIVTILMGIFVILVSWRWMVSPSQLLNERSAKASQATLQRGPDRSITELSLSAEDVKFQSTRRAAMELKNTEKIAIHKNYVQRTNEPITRANADGGRSQMITSDKMMEEVTAGCKQAHLKHESLRRGEKGLPQGDNIVKSQRKKSHKNKTKSKKTTDERQNLKRDSQDKVPSKIKNRKKRKSRSKLVDKTKDTSARPQNIHGQGDIRRSGDKLALSALNGTNRILVQNSQKRPSEKGKDGNLSQTDAVNKTEAGLMVNNSLHKKYLVYICNTTKHCSGFSDRQRAIVGLYLLSIATNRTFGVIMTRPANLIDFYIPNKVNWNLKAEDLAGKTSAYQQCVYTNTKCDLDDINTEYTQDVLYVKSTDNCMYLLGRNRHYRNNLPKWATGSWVVIFGQAWMTLMTPTNALRQGVNSLLLEVAKAMQADANIIPILHQSQFCRNACNKMLNKGKSQSVSINKCLGTLPNFRKVKGYSGIDFLSHICPVTNAIKPSSLNSIQTATGYDYVELELVCVQVRLGSNSSLKGEGRALNKFRDVDKIWDHVRPYINKGHHLYLASDSQQVKEQAIRMFGPRVHVNSDPIIHIDQVTKKQSGWQAMKTTLVEQLLLATSCKILVYSSTSGYSSRAAMVRHVLTKGRTGFELFAFANGRVTRMDLDHKPRTLPHPVS